MAEVAHTGKHHRYAVLIRSVYHFLVAHRATGLDDASRAGIHHHKINATLTPIIS